MKSGSYYILCTDEKKLTRTIAKYSQGLHVRMDNIREL